MFSIKFLLRLTENRRHSAFFLYLILLLSGIVLLDFYLCMQGSIIFGIYLIMSLLCLLSLVGLPVSMGLVSRHLEGIDASRIREEFPEGDFYGLTGAFLAGILLLIPGIISSFLGMFLLVKPLRILAGRILSDFLMVKWHEVYEYRNL